MELHQCISVDVSFKLDSKESDFGKGITEELAGAPVLTGSLIQIALPAAALPGACDWLHTSQCSASLPFGGSHSSRKNGDGSRMGENP